MSIPYRDRGPSWNTQEASNPRLFLIKIFIAVILMRVVIMNVSSVLPAPEPNIPITGAQPELDPTLTFKAEADAQVEEANPAVNAGASPELEVIHLGGRNVESYLRFTVHGLSGAVQNARVRVYSSTETAQDGPALYMADNDWTETRITWENRPKRASRQLGNQDLIRRYSWVEYDVTDLVSRDGTYSFVLVGDSEEDLIFSGRESSNGPELVLTLTSVTPTSVSESSPTKTATSATGTALTFTAAADASVAQASPDANQGTSKDLQVNGDSKAARITYLTFLVRGVHESIHNVKLRLFSTESTKDGPAVHFAERIGK